MKGEDSGVTVELEKPGIFLPRQESFQQHLHDTTSLEICSVLKVSSLQWKAWVVNYQSFWTISALISAEATHYTKQYSSKLWYVCFWYSTHATCKIWHDQWKLSAKHWEIYYDHSLLLQMNEVQDQRQSLSPHLPPTLLTTATPPLTAN